MLVSVVGRYMSRQVRVISSRDEFLVLRVIFDMPQYRNTCTRVAGAVSYSLAASEKEKKKLISHIITP